jgi:predicted N-formylglutamate amidohydrolase
MRQGVSRFVADAIDATLVQQNYSRGVVDCNRPPEPEASIPQISGRTPIPGNVALSAERKAERVREVFKPYHDRIEAQLNRRRQAGKPTASIAMHRFTPVFMGSARPWHVGVLYNRDRRFADILLALMKGEEGLMVGDNEPYNFGDLTDYTIPVHEEGRGLPHAEIEITPGSDRRCGRATGPGSKVRNLAAASISRVRDHRSAWTGFSLDQPNLNA